MHNAKKLRRSIVGIVIVLAVAIAVYVHCMKPSVVPSTIRKRANFAIFYPNPSKQIYIPVNSFKYDASLNQVAFVVRFAGRSVTFAEQPSPDSFAADPTFYSNFITKLGGYATFSSIDGTVSLTEPAQVDTQTAVMNTKGTLLFAKSSGNINENNWKLLFNSLSYTQP
jgi:hypothetical protein